MADEKAQAQQANEQARAAQRTGQQNQSQGDNRVAGGPHPNQGDQNAARRTEEASRASAEDAKRASAENIERARAERAERPQGVGGNPTPTQQENDEIRAGVRHLDDKEDDGSGPDYGVKRDEAMRAAFNRDQASNRENKTR